MAKEVHTDDSQEYQFTPVGATTLRFKVKAAHDAHVCLSSSDDQEASPIYEIFLGGWNNTKSALRRDREKPDRAEAETPDVVNADDANGFWVTWNAEGSVQVGKDGESEPFLSYVDPEPFAISHYGLRTAWGATGEWEIEGGATLHTPDDNKYQLTSVCDGHLKFSVKTDHDAHVALTTGPALGTPMYELFLGGWKNTKTALRKNQTKPDVAVAETPNILRADKYRGFELCWKKGLISLKDSSGATLLEWQDENLVPVSHYGIRTTWGAAGEWKIGTILTDADDDLAKEEVAGDAEEESNEVTEEPESDFGEAVWVPCTSGEVPEGAVVGGSDHDCDLIVARAQHEGALLPGKLVPSHSACYVSWDGGEHQKEEYEVLCGCTPKWVQVNTGDEIPDNALPGGRTVDGETLFIGRVPHEGTVTVGKVHPSHNSCYIPYGGEEVGFPEYEILVRQ